AQPGVIGMVAMHYTRLFHTGLRWCRVTTLVVGASDRGRGIGSRLLDTAEAAAKSAGCAGVELTCAAHRQDSHRFYRRRGYVERSLRFVKLLEGVIVPAAR